MYKNSKNTRGTYDLKLTNKNSKNTRGIYDRKLTAPKAKSPKKKKSVPDQNRGSRILRWDRAAGRFVPQPYASSGLPRAGAQMAAAFENATIRSKQGSQRKAAWRALALSPSSGVLPRTEATGRAVTVAKEAPAANISAQPSGNVSSDRAKKRSPSSGVHRDRSTYVKAGADSPPKNVRVWSPVTGWSGSEYDPKMTYRQRKARSELPKLYESGFVSPIFYPKPEPKCSKGRQAPCLAKTAPQAVRPTKKTAKKKKPRRRSVWTISGGAFETNRRGH